MAARRRWLAPAFKQPQRPQLLYDDGTGAAGYVMNGPQGRVSFCLNPGIKHAKLTLPGGGWRLEMSGPGGSLRAQNSGATELCLAPQSAVLLVSA